jgi:hypothetical protein
MTGHGPVHGAAHGESKPKVEEEDLNEVVSRLRGDPYRAF